MAKTLRLALVQSPLEWENPEQNRQYFSKVIQSLADGVDLVILPEMFTSGFTMHPERLPADEGQKTVAWMQQMAAERNAAVTGSLVYHENGHYHNRLFFIPPNGTPQHYDKRHTFTLAGESAAYKAGREKVVFEFRGFKICPMICYDLRFPVWARNVEAYDLLYYVANWPKPRINAWDTLLKARAIENMAYCVGVNRLGTDASAHEYPGHSAAFDGLGEQLAFSVQEEVLLVNLDLYHLTAIRQKLKFLDDRDLFTVEV